MPSSRVSLSSNGSVKVSQPAAVKVVVKEKKVYVELPATEKPKPRPAPKRATIKEQLAAYTAKQQPRMADTLSAVRPNFGLEVAYRDQLYKAIDRMHRSVVYWLSAAYRANPPEVSLVGDEMPVTGLKRSVRNLSSQWLKEFNQIAKHQAAKFVTQSVKQSEVQMKASLNKIGFTIPTPTYSPTVMDVLNASVQENVSLIKSIPQQYLTEVEQLVMRSIQQGRDLKSLTDELEERYHIARKRAALIAHDQNNKASANISRARQLEMGITEAVWLHSSAGKHPRPSHVKMNGKKFDLRVGMWDDNERRYVLPGELINCRCQCRAILPGLGAKR